MSKLYDERDDVASSVDTKVSCCAEFNLIICSSSPVKFSPLAAPFIIRNAHVACFSLEMHSCTVNSFITMFMAFLLILSSQIVNAIVLHWHNPNSKQFVSSRLNPNAKIFRPSNINEVDTTLLTDSHIIPASDDQEYNDSMLNACLDISTPQLSEISDLSDLEDPSDSF